MGRRALLARDRRARHGTDGPRGGVRRCPRLSPAAGPRPLCDLWTETGISGSDKTAARRILPESRRSEEHTSELQSLMRSSYAVFCLKNKHINTVLTSTTIKRATIIT